MGTCRQGVATGGGLVCQDITSATVLNFADNLIGTWRDIFGVPLFGLTNFNTVASSQFTFRQTVRALAQRLTGQTADGGSALLFCMPRIAAIKVR